MHGPLDTKSKGLLSWEITLYAIGWIFFLMGTVETIHAIQAFTDSMALNPRGGVPIHSPSSLLHIGLGDQITVTGWTPWIVVFFFKLHGGTFLYGIGFLFASYTVRSLEDALDHFKTQSVWASNYYSSLVEKDSPSVPPHEVEFEDGIEDT